MNFCLYQAEPHRRVAHEAAPRGVLSLGLFQVRAGRGQVTHPQPHRGHEPADVNQVPPRAEFPAESYRLLQVADRGRVVGSQPGELRELYQRDRRGPAVTQPAEGGQRATAVRLRLLDTAEHAVEGTALERHRRPGPRVVRLRVPVE